MRPSKARGQNFLVQTAVAERIVSLAEVESGDRVVEVGPGLGMLTEHILSRPITHLWAVELDTALAAGLRQKLGGPVSVIEMDFLRIRLEKIIDRAPVKVLGNLPFNSAAAILKHLSGQKHLISRMVLMFQREVGKRLRSRAGEEEYGALTVLNSLDWDIPAHFRVDAGNFYPRPKVDAEVLAFTPRPLPQSLVVPRSELERVIRAGFMTRRKSIRNSLSSGLHLGYGEVQTALEKAAIEPSQRAERLSLGDFIRLANALGVNSGGTPGSDINA